MKAGEYLSYILTASIHTNRLKLLNDISNSLRWFSEHSKIYEAVKAGDQQAAYDELRSHLENVCKLL